MWGIAVVEEVKWLDSVLYIREVSVGPPWRDVFVCPDRRQVSMTLATHARGRLAVCSVVFNLDLGWFRELELLVHILNPEPDLLTASGSFALH